MPINEVWGIDIGKSALKAVKMRRSKDDVEIIDIDLIPYEQPPEGTEPDRDEQVRKALIDFQMRHKVKNEPVYASIPGQATFNRIITIPPVEDKRIREIVTYEAQQQIPFPINEVIWDYQLIGGKEKGAGEEREVMLFAVRREIINNFLNILAAAQLNIKGIQIAPLAVYNFIRYEKPDLTPCVAVDIGAENTDLVVIDSEKLWLRAALPAAGNEITKAIQKRFNLSYDKAEELKLKAGKSQQATKIFEVMKPILKEIIGEINRSVGFYKSSGSKDIKFQRMIFMGNVTKLTGFDKFFAQNLQDQVEILSEVTRIHISPKLNVNLFQTNIPSFAVAMGLAIQGVGLAINKIRLLPKEWVDDELVRKQKMYLAIAVGLLAIVPLWVWYNKSQTISGNLEVARLIEQKLQPLKDKKAALDSVQDHGQQQPILESMTKIGTYRTVWNAILENVSQTFLDSAESIKQENDRIRASNTGGKLKPKIWILEQDFDFKVDIVKVQDHAAEIPYITSRIVVVFESLGDEVQSRGYILDMIIDPLHKVQFKDKPLFDSRRTFTSLEIRDTLFTGDSSTRTNAQYCQITMQFTSWLEMIPIVDVEQRYVAALQEPGGDEWQRFAEELANKQYPLSEEAKVVPVVADFSWRLKDEVKKYDWMIFKQESSQLKIYSICK